MKIKTIFFGSLAFLLIQCTNSDKKTDPRLIADVIPVEETYFGKTIVDQYRYMEDLDDPKVQEWFKSQADYSRSVLNSIPGRQKLIDNMRDFDGRISSRFSNLRITDDDRYFYLKTTPEDETGKLFYRDGFSGEEYFLYDAASFNPESDQPYVISGLSPSDDGSKIAFEVAKGGSESTILMIMDVASRELSTERIDRCWFASPSWLPDGNSFFYNRLNSADVHDENREKDSKTYLHVLGSDPTNDKDIFSRESCPELGINPEDFPMVYYDKDSKYMFAYAYTVDNRLRVFYTPTSELQSDKINWETLFVHEDEVYDFKVTDKDLYVYTPKNAPNYKLLKTTLENPDLTNATVIIDEDQDATLENYDLTKDGIFFTRAKNGVESSLYFKAYGSDKETKIELPFAAGSTYIGTKGFKFNDIWISIAGWVSDYKRYRYDVAKNEFIEENLSDIAEYPEFKELVAEEVTVKSHDGVMVPFSLIYNNDTKRDGNNPVLIFGYGAYGASMNPFFWPDLLLWTKEGGVLAIAHVRGGGELGDAWHKAGHKATKPNTWKDLIACTEYLINEQYTSPKKIAIYSASAGGILVGRAMTERPDLYAAVIPGVGCMNTLRGENSPNGPVNIPEFGTSKDSIECMALIEMDSYLHLEEGIEYPATLITAGMNDPRVIAWQPAKFAARLLEVNGDPNNDILFWADYDAGHGMGDTKTKGFESLADVLSFALWQTGHKDFKAKM